MPYRNLIEDMVRSMVDEVLSNDKDIANSVAHKAEIIAYVLNRTQPKYVTSERGILHGKISSKYAIQERTDILFLIYEAITVFKRRKSSSENIGEETLSNKHCLPHILGEVLEETTFSVISDVEITLLHNNKKIDMIDPQWGNPYQSNKSTRGYYHFWPEYTDDMGTDSVTFTLQFNHSKCKDLTKELTVDIRTWKERAKSYLVPITLLNVKDGIELDFLYD